MHKKAWVWLWFSAFIIVLDQVSKYFVVKYFASSPPYPILPFLNIWVNFNTGAAFGFLRGAGGWQIFLLSSISILVALVITLCLGKIPRRDWLLALSLSCILGGALGNLIDRLRFHYVIDFIDFHVGGWHFATFNVADSAITMGACFLLIRLLFKNS